jgi:hypothetical protein
MGCKKMSTKLEDIIYISFPSTAYTNTYTVNILFSLKQRRFIKPILEKHLELHYKLLPAKYLLLSSNGRTHIDPMTWIVKIVKIYKNEYNAGVYDTLNSTKWLTAWDYRKRSVPILKDIENPGYHGYPSFPTNKVYSEQEIQELLKGGVDSIISKELEELG